MASQITRWLNFSSKKLINADFEILYKTLNL